MILLIKMLRVTRELLKSSVFFLFLSFFLMASGQAVIGSEDSLKFLFGGDIEIKRGKWSIHGGLWLFQLDAGVDLNYTQFPSINFAALSDNVSSC